MDERRQQRVADALRDEISELVVYELTDPRIQLLGITGVHISPDGRKADVLIRTEGSAQERDATLKALAHAAGFLKRELARRLALRQVPDLRFVSDTGAASNEQMEALLKKAQKWRKKLESQPEASGVAGTHPSKEAR